AREPARVHRFGAGDPEPPHRRQAGVAIDDIEGPGSIRITTRVSDDAVTISIEDSGSGIPEHLRHRVLEPFFTTKPPGQGTGLGLSITHSIVTKHGGSLELGSRPGGGTRAVIRIPIEKAK